MTSSGPEGTPTFRAVAEIGSERAVLRPAGELDLATVRAFRTTAQQVIDASAPEIVIDFSQLRFIDSSGVVAVIDLIVEVRDDGRRLDAVGLDGQVQRMLQLTKVTNMLTQRGC